jgi:hypothetical protein
MVKGKNVCLLHRGIRYSNKKPEITSLKGGYSNVK